MGDVFSGQGWGAATSGISSNRATLASGTKVVWWWSLDAEVVIPYVVVKSLLYLSDSR